MRSLQRHGVEFDPASPSPSAPGKRTLTEGLGPRGRAGQPVAATPVQARRTVHDLDAAFDFTGVVQRRAEAALTTAAITDTAATGVAGAASPLPHGADIQRAFGRHDVSGVKAQIGGPAAAKPTRSPVA